MYDSRSDHTRTSKTGYNRSKAERGEKAAGERIKHRPPMHKRAALAEDLNLTAVEIDLDAPAKRPVADMLGWVGVQPTYPGLRRLRDETLPEWERELLRGRPFSKGERFTPAPRMGHNPFACAEVHYDTPVEHLQDCVECCHEWAFRYDPDYPHDQEDLVPYQDLDDAYKDEVGHDLDRRTPWEHEEPEHDGCWLPLMSYVDAIQTFGEDFIVEGPNALRPLGARHSVVEHAYLRAWEVADALEIGFPEFRRLMRAEGENAVRHPFHLVALPVAQRLYLHAVASTPAS